MEHKAYSEFIEKNKTVFDQLSERRIYFVTDLSSGGLLQAPELIVYNSECFSDSDLELVQILIESAFIHDHKYPLLIETPKAVSLYKKNGNSESRETTALLLSRLSFMGTDGMRGKVVKNKNKLPVREFHEDNLLTPDLIKISSFAYAKMLLDAGVVKEGDTACVGNDGRDITTGWELKKAMIDGFHSAGLRVCDIGINPTPYVPWKMLQSSYAAGAMLTASHNPANQNGIKFFLHGKKNLPEGELGDYSFAAWMYGCSLEKIKAPRKTEAIEVDIKSAAESLLWEMIPRDLLSRLGNPIIVLDNANGAYADLSLSLLKKLKADYICVNEIPSGENINRACGVAEIEGLEEFPPSGYEGYLKVVQEVFNQGRKGDRPVYAIVLDGDGDRGFILNYDREKDTVYTINGDKSGYIIADYFIRSRNLNPHEYNFILTVESDLMTAYYAEKTLGLKSHIVSVGDKWICTFNEGPLLVGLESSGHLIFPIPFTNEKGSPVELRAGNGLLTALMVLSAIGELKLTGKQIREPFEAGFSKTFYTYFVDKTLFYRGSPVWNKDLKIIRDEIQKQILKGNLNPDTELVIENKEETHMLYISILEKGSQLASIFCRNSGTEDKTAVYVKCRQEFKEILLPIGEMLRDNHLASMKNKDRIEYKYEKIIVQALSALEGIPLSRLKSVLDKEFSNDIIASNINESDIYSVVYALKKEGRASINNDLIRLNN
jgi:phosphomannomutase